MSDFPALWPQADGLRRFPTFSLEERDRRWGRVRQLMAEAGVACLLAPGRADDEEQANSRYLSQIGGPQRSAWVVFPYDGEATAIVSSAREASLWKDLQGWITDLRWGRESELVIERLRELRPTDVVGVTNLRAMYRYPEGTVPFESWSRITSALPEVRFEPNNDVLDFARMVKGPEEVAAIERATAANERAIQAMFETARPGVEEATVWVAMLTAMIQATGEFPARLSIATNREANSTCGQACPYVIPAGGRMSQEICSRSQGYRAQCNHTVVIGRPVPDDYERAMRTAVEVYYGLLEWIRPGRTIGELLAEYQRLAEERGATVSSAVVHTNGLGSDRPRLGPGVMPGDDSGIVIQPGFTFTIKPSVRMKNSGMYAQVGDPLTVTEDGARRLGKRPLEPVAVG